MHVAGADGADAAVPPAEGDEGRAAFGGAADGNEPLLGLRVLRVRGDAREGAEEALDLLSRQAVLLRLGEVAVVPVEVHRNVCTDVCAVKGAGVRLGQGDRRWLGKGLGVVVRSIEPQLQRERIADPHSVFSVQHKRNTSGDICVKGQCD